MDREFSTWWEIPWIAYFVSLYKNPFDISEFSIYELEECLETDDPQSRLFFTTLLSELLRYFENISEFIQAFNPCGERYELIVHLFFAKNGCA